ncbi:spore maturation protein [Paenibacillus swuensis]|uniref:Spore maturation protein n=1 Tax=Paenibacillus swuensis TaxID=1178515 RepID=A0A172TGG0_9BACL|nr:glycosyltransferase [Paenibacillus swuensis]ANE46100.1 spore maturation protein [Paenibacillus swuensis]
MAAHRKARRIQTSSRDSGFQLGWSHGYMHGAGQAILHSLPPEAYPLRNLRVLLIPQGFEGIDNGVITALRTLVTETIVGNQQDIQGLAAMHRPDLVLVINGLHTFPPDHPMQIQAVRAMGIKTAVWFADDPYFTDFSGAIAVQYDVVFTHELSCIPYYTSLGCAQVHYLPLGVNPAVYRPQHVGAEYRSDVCFIGNGFTNRTALFDQMAPYLSRIHTVIAGSQWEKMRNYKLLQKRIRLEWIPTEESVKYYSGAKIVINLHRAADDEIYNRNRLKIPAHSINPRTYEISACGTLQLTDIRQDLSQFYTPGHDIVTFSNAAELTDKIQYYLNHEDERRTIALRGLKRTYAEHTFHKRLNQMLQMMYSS